MRALWQALFSCLAVAKVPFFQGFAQHETCIGPTWRRASRIGPAAACAGNAAILVAKCALSACSDSSDAERSSSRGGRIGGDRRVIATHRAAMHRIAMALRIQDSGQEQERRLD